MYEGTEEEAGRFTSVSVDVDVRVGVDVEVGDLVCDLLHGQTLLRLFEPCHAKHATQLKHTRHQEQGNEWNIRQKKAFNERGTIKNAILHVHVHCMIMYVQSCYRTKNLDERIFGMAFTR